MVRLLKLAVGLLALLALSVACRETVNVGTVAVPTWDNVGGFTVAVTVPGNARSGQAGLFTVNITGGTGPFEVVYTFDDCVTPRTTTHNITGRQDQLDVVFDTVTTETTCTLVVNVEDSAGRTATRTRTFTLRTTAADTAPTISSVTFDTATCVATVTAADAEGDDITINATAPTGFSVDAASKPLGAGGTVTFTFAADDPLAGATGTASFTATANGLTSTASTVDIDCDAIALAADTLYAIPSSTSVAAGEPVRITVFTGDPASPLTFVNGVRVIYSEASGGTYVDNSFNVGAPGGDADDIDGFWSAMTPAPSGFLLAPDSFILERDLGSGFTGIDFNVTPLGGTDVDTGEGALFNFELTFTTPGTYQLGFQEADTIPRTYYTDMTTAPNRFWGDITNLHTGVPSSITVTAAP